MEALINRMVLKDVYHALEDLVDADFGAGEWTERADRAALQLRKILRVLRFEFGEASPQNVSALAWELDEIGQGRSYSEYALMCAALHPVVRENPAFLSGVLAVMRGEDGTSGESRRRLHDVALALRHEAAKQAAGASSPAL